MNVDSVHTSFPTHSRLVYFYRFWALLILFLPPYFAGPPRWQLGALLRASSKFLASDRKHWLLTSSNKNDVLEKVCVVKSEIFCLTISKNPISFTLAEHLPPFVDRMFPRAPSAAAIFCTCITSSGSCVWSSQLTPYVPVDFTSDADAFQYIVVISDLVIVHLLRCDYPFDQLRFS